MSQKQQEQDRLTAVEISVAKVETSLEVIKNNHLAHLDQDIKTVDKKIDRLDMRVWGILFSIIVLIATSVISITFS